jgi:stage II sporulation protein R
VGEREEVASTEYLRIHIRANSDSDYDQDIKETVKTAVINYLTPYISSSIDKESALRTLNEQLDNVKSVVDNVLAKNGLIYTSKVSVKKEQFPLRTYNDVTLPSGTYDALIIDLGEASGNNWWCVVYPPLCFTTDVEYEYKSKIQEIIDKYFR